MAALFEEHRTAGLVPARVIAVHRDSSVVAAADGDRSASVSGRLRFVALGPADYPAVGDWVALDPGTGVSSEPVGGTAGGPTAARADTDTDEVPAAGLEAAIGSSVGAVIAAILPRRTTFRRSTGSPNRRGEARLADEQVMAANVDVALLVAGLDDDFNLRRMERYLAVSAACQIRAVVVLNKSDIGRDQDQRVLAIREIAPTVQIVAVSARSGSGMAELSDVLVPGTTAVILGSSGVGKSTLVNALLGEDRQATGEVRESDSRGRHTTTHRELFVLPTGALLIDTPGIRALEVLGAEEGVEDTFADIDEIAAGCRFGNCRHNGEPGCQIAVALADGRLIPERLASHAKLEREAAHTARAVDPRARAEEQRRWKLIHKTVSRHMDTKYGADR